MKSLSFLTATIIAVSLMSCSSKNESKVEEYRKAEAKYDTILQRGKYLVSTIGCADCHSPKVMTAQGPQIVDSLNLSGYPSTRPLSKTDLTAMKDGYVFMNGDLTATIGPWGVTYAANITSDATGIGNWTEEQFIIAMTEGKYKGLRNARNLLPPMPWQNFKQLSKEDLNAIFTYLKATKPVRNVVPNIISLEEFNNL